MISYQNFFRTLKTRDQSQYSLIRNAHVSSGLLYILRKNSTFDPEHRIPNGIETKTLARLCNTLNCRPEDILEQDQLHDDHIRETIRLAREKEH